ncbi:hypothetical protein ACN47E_005399 [Coniothyrium glycines]
MAKTNNSRDLRHINGWINTSPTCTSMHLWLQMRSLPLRTGSTRREAIGNRTIRRSRGTLEYLGNDDTGPGLRIRAQLALELDLGDRPIT